MIQDSVSLFKNVLTWALALLFAQGLFAQDGSGSAGMWVWNASSASGAIVSKPSDTNGERSCLTYILIREK